MDEERDDKQHSDDEGDATEGDAQQNEQTSGDEQSVADDPEIEAERRAASEPSRTERN